MNNKIQAVFIDRDGTIGVVGTKVIYPDEFKPFDFTKEAISLLKKQNI